MGHFILGKYGHERSGHRLELVQLVLIIGGSLLDNWEAAFCIPKTGLGYHFFSIKKSF
jgi:hypothetical protein